MPPIAPEAVVDNRYELAEPAEGLGHGTCWKARDRWERLRARLVRILRPVGPGVIAPPDAQLRALQTVRHPSVLPLLHHGVWQSRPYLVQEWFDGLSLDRLFALDPTLRGEVSVAAARSIADQVASALEAALEASPLLTHGALDAGQVLVLDIHNRRPEVRVVGFCTAAWEARAPEATPLDDVRALARLLRAMLSPAPGRWRDGTPAGLIAWVDRCVSPDLAAQNTSAADLRKALRTAWTDAPAPAPTPARSESAAARFEAPPTPPPAAPPAPREVLAEAPPSFASDEIDEATQLSPGVREPAGSARGLVDDETSGDSTAVQRALNFSPVEEEQTDVTHRVGAQARGLRPVSHVGDPEHPGDVTVQRTSLKHLGPPRRPVASAATPSDDGEFTTQRAPSQRAAPTPPHAPPEPAPAPAPLFVDETQRAPDVASSAPFAQGGAVAPVSEPWRAGAYPQGATSPATPGWPTAPPGAASPLAAPPLPPQARSGRKAWVIVAALATLLAALVAWWWTRR